MKFNVFNYLNLKMSVFKISIVITAFFMLLAYWVEQNPTKVPFLSAMSLRNMVDRKMEIRGSREVARDIVLVNVDDESFEELGKWPWKRSLFAKVFDQISRGNPKVIAVNLTYSEADPNTLTPVFNQLLDKYKNTHQKDMLYKDVAQYAHLSDQDRILSEKIKEIGARLPVVLGYFFFFGESQVESLALDWQKEFEQIVSSQIKESSRSSKKLPETIPMAIGAKASVPMYAQATPHHAFFDLSTDLDGTIRRAPFIVQYQNKLFPSLGLKTVALALNKKISVNYSQSGVKEILLGNDRIPTTADGQFWINYAGPSNTFESVSFLDIYQGKVDARVFENKIVLLGLTAKALTDTLVTPVDNAHSAIEINATIIENLLHKKYLTRNSVFYTLEMLFILLAGMLLAFLYTKLKAIASAVLSVFFLIVYVAVDYKFLFLNGYLANSFIPALHLLSVFLATTAFKYFHQEKRSRHIKKAFQYYVAPAVVNEMISHPDKLTLGGKRQNLSVVFLDIRNFTTLSEKISPEKLTELLSRFMTKMTKVIIKENGMVDKYVGDEIMALFGAPISTQTHSVDACRAAVQMCQHLPYFRDLFKKYNLSSVEIGVGINSGDVIIGNMGSEDIFSYTCIGDEVNLASRLESATKHYGATILTSDAVYEKAKNDFHFREIDFIQLKGKAQATTVYELFVSKPPSGLCEGYAQALLAYRSRDFQKAKDLFSAVLKEHPSDKPSGMFQTRCQEFIQKPPSADWKGAFVMESK